MSTDISGLGEKTAMRIAVKINPIAAVFLRLTVWCYRLNNELSPDDRSKAKISP